MSKIAENKDNNNNIILSNNANINDINNNDNNNKKVNLLDQFVIEGWVYKKSRYLKKYRQRWLVLKNYSLYSYKNKKIYTNPTEIIDITNIIKINKILNNNDEHKYCFEIIYNNIVNNKQNNFIFAAYSMLDLNAWINEIEKILNITKYKKIYKDIKGNIISYGCKHFMRNCVLYTKCCKKWYFCSYCHDEIEDNDDNYDSDSNNNDNNNDNNGANEAHTLNRKDITKIKCLECGLEQIPTKQCLNKKCNTIMAKYFCEYCKFFDNSNKQYFHCKLCGVCRSGNENHYIHCNKCGVCLEKTYYHKHKCMESATQCDCPICDEYIHMSNKAVTFWPKCGHAIHVACMQDYLQYDTDSIGCPICRNPWIPN